MLQFHDFFLKNIFLSNVMYDKNMMLWNEKPNKNETLPVSIVFMRYQRFHIFNIFYDFHRLLWRHEIIGCIIRISKIIIFFSLFFNKTSYITCTCLNIALQLMTHIYKLCITWFTTYTFSATLFILRDAF